MSIKRASADYLEPIAVYTMIAGIIALCQPWSLTLHSYGAAVTLIGLVAFSIFSHIKPDSGGD